MKVEPDATVATAAVAIVPDPEYIPLPSPVEPSTSVNVRGVVPIVGLDWSTLKNLFR